VTCEGPFTRVSEDQFQCQTLWLASILSNVFFFSIWIFQLKNWQ
jgi:hypothetical protein